MSLIIDPTFKQRVLHGRKAVDAYRTAHIKLHQVPYYRSVHDDHTPLLDIMLRTFKKQGFNSIQEFFDASKLLNIQELGFAARADFEAKVTDADMEALEGMWQ